MQRFTIKRGDTSPALRYALIPSDITLAGASVRFQMRLRGGSTVIDAPATVVSVTPPVVQHVWQAGETAEVGWFEGEFRVQYADNAIETFPNDGFINIFIGPDVEDLP